jgi:hypothetical protein
VYNGEGGGALQIVSSTIKDTDAQTPVDSVIGFPMILNDKGADAVNVKGSILAAYESLACEGDLAGFQLFAQSHGHNVITHGGTCADSTFLAPSDKVTDDPKLGALTQNGYQTWHYTPFANSPAVENIDAADCTWLDGSSVVVDQVDTVRLSSPTEKCDSGSIEHPTVATNG